MPAIDPDIIRRQVVIGAAALSPDGGRVVYTRRTVVAGRYQTSLWLENRYHPFWMNESDVLANLESETTIGPG